MSEGRLLRARADLCWSLVGLLALVLWDAFGADLPLTHLYGDSTGFAWRDAWFTRTLLHIGGRCLAAALLCLQALDAVRPWRSGPSQPERRYWLAAVVSVLMSVPALKRLSLTSCPWDLAAFGGNAVYVPHWLLGVSDGGSGHCFPSGHAVAAFAFFGVYFLWRSHRPRRAQAALVAVWALGLLFGWAQVARGAHFVSHTLWSAWLCWVICCLAAWLRTQPPRPTRRVGAAAEVQPGFSCGPHDR